MTSKSSPPTLPPRTQSLVNNYYSPTTPLVPAIEQLLSSRFAMESSNQIFSSPDSNRIQEINEQSLPNDAENFQTVWDQTICAAEYGIELTQPGMMAYFNGGGGLFDQLARVVLASFNRFGGWSEVAPGMAAMEVTARRWMAEMLGLPPTSTGYFTGSGSSQAILNGIHTARVAQLKESQWPGTIYLSQEAHPQIFKGARMLGIPTNQIRILPVDEKDRMEMQELEKTIEEDQAAGRNPFLIIANVGTTNTGAIDPLKDIRRVANQHGLWVHGDGAYGALFYSTPKGKIFLEGLPDLDSINISLSKSLFGSMGSGGLLLVREGSHLQRAFHAGAAEYMPEQVQTDAAQISPDLSRHHVGIYPYLALRILGANFFRDQLTHKLELTRWLAKRIREIPNMVVINEPQLTVLLFRYDPDEHHPKEVDDLNLQLVQNINKGPFLLSTTQHRGTLVIRVAILGIRTDEKVVEALVQRIREWVRGRGN